MATNIAEAVKLIENYQREYSKVTSSRLHCYLPAWAAGVNVEFRPRNSADIRFNGLLDADEQGRREMRDRINSLLDQILTVIVDGASKDEVYEAWQKICAPEVEKADVRFSSSAAPLPELPFNMQEVVRSVSENMRHDAARVNSQGESVHVAIALDGNLKHEAQVVVEGMVSNTKRPLHVYVLCRDHSQNDMDAVVDLFPEVEFTWIPCDSLDYGEITGMLSHITVSTMDRLMLPYL
ncbi:hypothetical protein [Nesterenkonia pannonica]|uniref:hypothetical protein n=1 Tax=Nesterenkonia pannonica TaxID=1548602 RepID=UPI002164B2A9|nr:hypothetical protein [Nesterenkonia pannonica]